MTHDEACTHLLSAARRYARGDITRAEWCQQVDEILCERYPNDRDPAKRRARGLPPLDRARRTSTPTGTQPLAAA